jgi:fibronectin type 3 domain-containing protein
LAYTLLREWAVGTVAGSRETVYYFGPWDIAFRDRGGNHSFGYRLYEQTIGYDKSLAEALNLTRAFTVDSVDGVVWSNRLLFNMYGDPTLTMINHQEEDESRIRIVHPVQYTRVDIGLPHSITWESRNVTGNVAIDLSRDGGFTWSTIIADTPNDHSETTTFTGPESYLARLRIRSLADPAIKDVSDYIFYIKLPPLPETPTHVSATDGAFTDRVLIGWQPSDYVSSYTILRGTGPVLFELGTVPFNAFFDMDVQAGTTYTYRVRANNASGSSENSQTDTGYIRTVIQIPTAPPTVNASDGAYADRVRIQWEESEGASFYRVFRAPATSGPVIYAEIGTSDTIVFDDLTAEQNTVYSYKIKGANYLFESAFSISDSGYRTYKSDLPDPPAVVSASDGEYADRVLVSWKPAANALGYNIYRARKTIGLPIYGKIGSSRSTAFEDDTAVPETVYEYAVSSLASMFESDLSDPNSGYASILVAPPEAPTGLDASDGTHPGMVRITWSPVDGAALYNLYRAMDGAATPLYLLIGDTGNNSFDDYGVYPGRTYLYRVQAVNEMGISSTSNTDTGFCGCVGDFDGDGDTDGTDLAEFAAALEDGTNILTYLKFASYFGLQCF